MNEIYKTLEFDAILERLVNYSKLPLNKERILSLPLMFDKVQIEEELNKVNEAIRIINLYGSVSFDYIHNIYDSVEKAVKGGICLEEELYRIGKQSSGIKVLQEIYANVKEDKYPLMSYYIQSLIPLRELERKIDRVLGPDFIILDTASSELARIRKEINNKNVQIRKKLDSIIKANPSYLSDSLITIRNDRLVIPVKSSYKNTVSGIIHDESSSQMTAFIEPEAVVILNNEIASLKIDERKEIEKILRELSKEVAINAKQLCINLDCIKELDFVFAKARYAIDNNAIAASISDSEIKLLGAAHPLLPKDKVILNNFTLGKDNPNILLITGPNTGGKTVALKTLGLLVLMNQAGLAVNANEAVLPIFRRFYADIGDSQSIEQSLSTFSSHLLKLKEMVDNADEHTLIIIDEIGGGTDPSEGESISMAALDYFHSKGSTVLASTHYSNLKSYGLEKDYILSGCMKFDEESLRPTYKLVLNLSGRSYAFEIAQSLEFNQDIIESAKKYRKHYLSSQAEMAEKLDKQLLLAASKQEELDKLLEESKQKNIEIDNLRDSLKKKQEKINEEVNQIVNEKVEDALKEVNEIMQDLKNNNEKKLHEVIDAKAKLNKVFVEEEVISTSNDSFNIGDNVELVSIGKAGKVSAVKGDKITIEINGKTLTCNKSELKHSSKKEEKPIVKAKERVFVAIKPELNLIGERVEEALKDLDMYISDCLRYNLKEVRIIHGFGTGALQNAVWNYLKKCPYVKSYEFCSYNAGGQGATLVKF